MPSIHAKLMNGEESREGQYPLPYVSRVPMSGLGLSCLICDYLLARSLSLCLWGESIR